MKKLFMFVVMIAFASSTAFAQFITEEVKRMSLGSKNALSIELPRANDKDVQKAWEKFSSKEMKGKSKYDRKLKEVFTEGSRIADMSYNSFNTYAKTTADGAGTVLTVWVDLGDNFLDSENDPDEYKAIEKQLYAFALVVARQQLKSELKEEEKTLKKMEGELKKLGRDKKTYEAEIERAKELIAKREADIEKNITDQENKTMDIESQKRVIENTEEKISDLN